jgi:hypothetical protein
MAKEDVDIKLGLDAKSFQRGLTSVRASAKQWSNEVASSFKSAFAVGAVLAGIKTLADQMLQLKRNAEDFGTSIEFLQGIQRLSVKFGGSAEDANNALTKLAETIGQARTEGGAAEDKFKRFGISLYDTAGQAKTTEEVFKDIANAYRNSSDAATKAALAFEFFGRTGRNINNILGEGADGIDSYTKQMERFWLVASPEKVNAMADAWNRLKASISGLAANILGGAASGLQFSFGLMGALSTGASVRDALNAASEAAGYSGQIAERGSQAVDQAQRLAAENQKLADIAERTEKIRRDGVAETDKERLANLSIEIQMARDAMQAEDDKVKRAEKLLKLEELKTKEGELQRKIAADAASLQMERMDRIGEIEKRRKELTAAREDRTKFTLGELAGANVRGVSDPALRADIMKAREVQRLQGQAERLRLSGRAGSIGEAQGLLNRADELRQSIGSLRSEERLTNMDRNIADTKQAIREMNTLSKETGIKVRPLFG